MERSNVDVGSCTAISVNNKEHITKSWTFGKDFPYKNDKKNIFIPLSSNSIVGLEATFVNKWL